MSNNATEVADDAEQPDDVRSKRDKHDAAIKEMLDALKQARKDAGAEQPAVSQKQSHR